MVSDKPKEIARRDEQHLATGGSRDTAAFDGRSPMAGEDGKVHTMTPRPPETSLLRNPPSPQRVIRDSTEGVDPAPGSEPSDSLEPSSDQ